MAERALGPSPRPPVPAGVAIFAAARAAGVDGRDRPAEPNDDRREPAQKPAVVHSNGIAS